MTDYIVSRLTLGFTPKLGDNLAKTRACPQSVPSLMIHVLLNFTFITSRNQYNVNVTICKHNPKSGPKPHSEFTRLLIDFTKLEMQGHSCISGQKTDLQLGDNVDEMTAPSG